MNNLFSSNLIVLIGGAIVLLVVIAQWLAHQRYKVKLEQLNQDVEKLRSTLNALCSSAVGVDRRMNKLEQDKIELQQRQETIEQHSRSDRPYAEAIRLAQQGAAASKLVDEFNMSSNEADLIVMLHGVKQVS
ncbi:MAG: DUF2802 domain-containing protein [Candidatus Polarisedimenticolaceae bacterium]|nr:DUF2802 domain-containing protein [Candidatus Polarisedimenticolaceae bacterium]